MNFENVYIPLEIAIAIEIEIVIWYSDYLLIMIIFQH
jgi:hypothetical protein